MVRGRGRFQGVLNPDEYERPKKSGLPKIGNSAPKKVATDSNKICRPMTRAPGVVRGGGGFTGGTKPTQYELSKKNRD